MRSSILVVNTVAPVILLQKDRSRSVMMINNTDALNAVSVQTRPSAGDTGQFWPIPAGQTFTLDPSQPAFTAAIQDDWWICSPTGAAVSVAIFQG
jgi:hypothetical protein